MASQVNAPFLILLVSFITGIGEAFSWRKKTKQKFSCKEIMPHRNRRQGNPVWKFSGWESIGSSDTIKAIFSYSDREEWDVCKVRIDGWKCCVEQIAKKSRRGPTPPFQTHAKNGVWLCRCCTSYKIVAEQAKEIYIAKKKTAWIWFFFWNNCTLERLSNN
jgi:hypothetical protein